MWRKSFRGEGKKLKQIGEGSLMGVYFQNNFNILNLNGNFVVEII